MLTLCMVHVLWYGLVTDTVFAFQWCLEVIATTLLLQRRLQVATVVRGITWMSRCLGLRCAGVGMAEERRVVEVRVAVEVDRHC